MSTTLKVWSFHKSIPKTAKEDLLRHFNATHVHHVGRRGKDEAVLARFNNEADCKYALEKLHQQKVLGVRLKAVYKDVAEPLPSQQPHKCKENTKPDESTKEKEIQKKFKLFQSNLCFLAPALGVNHPIPPHLKYLYPPPSATVIANIAALLMEVPHFYTQVLHLMNKMNLPTPFHPVEEVLPIHKELLQVLRQFETPDIVTNNDTAENEDDGKNICEHESSESESELESDAEGERRTRPTPIPIKRRSRLPQTVRKKPKLSLLKQSCIPAAPQHSRLPEVNMRDVFETTDTQGSRRLELRLENTTLPSKDDPQRHEDLAESGSFGKMKSVPSSTKESVPGQSVSMVEWQREGDKYIKKEDIINNRVPKSEWPILPVFKNYNAGEPSVKLYIKNLAKTTTEKDLKFVFGRYVFWQNEEEASRFSINLMKEGRMKGQAFITFPDVKQASEALQDTNGFILNDKPMVVAFGRVKTDQPKDTNIKQ